MNQTETVTSTANETVKHLARLARDSALRREERCFLTEGDKLTEHAISAGCSCRMLCSTDGVFPSGAESGRRLILSPRCAEKISVMANAPSVFGVFSLPEDRRARFEAPGRFLALEGVQDPGNIGTILRTALAFGADGVITDRLCGDLFSPKALRASMGAALNLPVLLTESMPDALNDLKRRGCRLFATALTDRAVLLPDVQVPESFVLAVGNEGHGLSDEALALADETVLIPMSGAIQSLNAATAAAVALYEFFVRGGVER